jgi:carbamate kinase
MVGNILEGEKMTSQKKAVIAIGGNSLVKDKEHQAISDQYKAVTETTIHMSSYQQFQI